MKYTLEPNQDRVASDVEQPKGKLVSEKDAAQAFINDYQELCRKHGFQIVVVPAFKAMADTGTFNVVLQTSVGRLPKEE